MIFKIVEESQRAGRYPATNQWVILRHTEETIIRKVKIPMHLHEPVIPGRNRAIMKLET